MFQWFEHILTELTQLREMNILESIKLPFAIKLVEAECLSYFKKNYNICIEKLSLLLSYVNKHLEESTEELELWKWRKQRVLFSLANQMLLQHDYKGAISILKELIEKNEKKEEEKYLVSLLIRVYLQAGKTYLDILLNISI